MEVAEQIGGYTQFRVELDPVGDITVGDLSYVTSDVSTENKTLEQFLNIATAKPIFLNPNYVTFSASVGYMYNPIAYGFTERDMQQYPSNSSALGIGFTKSVRIIEGIYLSDNKISIISGLRISGQAPDWREWMLWWGWTSH